MQNTTLSPGQKIAAAKMVGGAAVAAGGLFLAPRNPKTGAEIFSAGTSLFADGLASGIAESLGGDTCPVPATESFVWMDILSGIGNMLFPPDPPYILPSNPKGGIDIPPGELFDRYVRY